MNKYLRAAFCVPFGLLKIGMLKVMHPRSFRGPVISMVSPFTEITLDRGGKLTIGEGFKMRDGAKLRVRKCAVCKIGKNSSVSTNNFIVCRESVEIGDNVMLSPNVQVYDHDHDYRAKGGIQAKQYKTSPIKIGNDVWIGANAVILRGADIGDNCVIGAGAIVNGKVPAGTVLVQKRTIEIRGGGG